MTVTFAKPRLMRWNGNAITDHNRSEVGIEPERIENKLRTANGTLRKYVIADKRNFDVSWDMLPKLTSQTVDGFWGGQAIETFYNNIPGAFSLELTHGDGDVETYTVMISEFSKTIVKRGSVDFWNVTIGMEEV